MLTYEIADAGGSAVRCLSLAKGLIRAGHRVTMVTAGGRGFFSLQEAESDGVRLLSFAGLGPRRIRHGGVDPSELLHRLLRTTKDRYDVVHGFGHRPTVTAVGLFYRRVHKVPYVADWADLFGPDGIGGWRSGLSSHVIGHIDGRGVFISTRKWSNGHLLRTAASNSGVRHYTGESTPATRWLQRRFDPSAR
jgi:hypothetical protein